MTTLARWQRTITDEAGNIQPGATVEVRSEVTGALASIYSDRSGLVGIANPGAADGEGFFAFHAVGGAYRIDATKNGFTRTFRYVGIGILSEMDDVTNFIIGNARRTVTTGTVTINPVTDDLVIVAMSPASAVDVNFPTCAARIAANGRWVGVKNNHANPALYPVTPVRSGSDTIDDTATPLPQDTNRVKWYKPTAAGDWEIQNG